MPLDKHNSIMATATSLISSLFNITLTRDMAFCQLQQLQWFYQSLHLFFFVLHIFLHYYACDDLWYIQYSSQVTSRIHALRGMRAREKLARVQGCFEELRAKPKSPESSTIANLPERLLLRVLAQS